MGSKLVIVAAGAMNRQAHEFDIGVAGFAEIDYQPFETDATHVKFRFEPSKHPHRSHLPLRLLDPEPEMRTLSISTEVKTWIVSGGLSLVDCPPISIARGDSPRKMESFPISGSVVGAGGMGYLGGRAAPSRAAAGPRWAGRGSFHPRAMKELWSHALGIRSSSMKRSALAMLALAILACATPAAATEVDFTNNDNKALYALGQLLSARLGPARAHPGGVEGRRSPAWKTASSRKSPGSSLASTRP